MAKRSGNRPNGYECVEPDLGNELWRLNDPDTDATLRRKLVLHLEICADCRLRRDVERRFETEVSAGRLRFDEHANTTSTRRRGRPPARWASALRQAGAIAVAAGLVLVFLLPPLPRGGDRRLRSDRGEIILRPVEGEVLVDRTPRLRWRPIPGATAYDLTVDEVAGTFAWHGRTTATELEIPESAPLPAEADYRAILEPVPADLGPPGGVSVSFRTGAPGAFVRYRVGAARPAAYWLGGAGLALLVAAAVAGLRRT